MNKEIDKDKLDFVLYHGSCSDGFGSAFIVWLYYKKKFGLDTANTIKYIPSYYQKDNQSFTAEFLEQFNNKNVLMCDFSYKYDLLNQLISISKSFMIVDHHKTAEADLLKIPDSLKIFDMNRSGVGITWDLFFPDQPLPTYLAFIQDRDIWTYKIPKTSEFIAYFYEQEFDFQLWETFLDEDVVQKSIDTGSKWLDYQKILIDKVIKKTSYIIQEINNQYSIVLYLNSSDFKSDIGNKVFNSYPFGDFSCVWDYNLYSDQTNFSLRSTKDRYDVSLIAGQFNGGGHRNASGMVIKGLTGSLPYKRIDDPGILSLLIHGTREKLVLPLSAPKKDNINLDTPYIIFKVKEIRPEWLEVNYLNLIKRKCIDCVYIVFEKQSESVHVDSDTNDIIPLKEYTIHFNEKAYINPLLSLQYMAYVSKDHVIAFTTSKNFSELFTRDYNSDAVYHDNDSSNDNDNDRDNDNDSDNDNDNDN